MLLLAPTHFKFLKCTHQRRIEGGAVHSDALVGILVRRGVGRSVDADAGRREAGVAGEGEAGGVVLAGADRLTRHRVGHYGPPVLAAGATATSTTSSAGSGRRAVQGATGGQVRSPRPPSAARRGATSSGSNHRRRIRVLRKSVGTERPRGGISASSAGRLAALAVLTSRGAHRRGVCHHQRLVHIHIHVHVRGSVLRRLGTRRQELQEIGWEVVLSPALSQIETQIRLFSPVSYGYIKAAAQGKISKKMHTAIKY